MVFPSESGGVIERASVFFARTVERLGLNQGKEERFKITFHSPRRTWATRLLKRGVSLSVIRDLGGWADLTILSRYLASDLNGQRAAIDLPDQAPSPSQRKNYFLGGLTNQRKFAIFFKKLTPYLLTKVRGFFFAPRLGGAGHGRARG